MDKPEALRLADDVELNHKYCPVDVLHEAAAELRRQHEEITQLRHGAAATNLCIVGLVSQRDALLEALKRAEPLLIGPILLQARAVIKAVEETK